MLRCSGEKICVYNTYKSDLPRKEQNGICLRGGEGSQKIEIDIGAVGKEVSK